MLFGGSDEGPQGSRWLIHGPLPHVKWVEKRKGPFGSLERVLLVLTLLESGSGKQARFRGKFCCLGAPMGVPKSQMADTWPLATCEVG